MAFTVLSASPVRVMASAQQQQQQQQRTKVVSRAFPTCSLSMKPEYAQVAITDDANADVCSDSKTEMASSKCVHPQRKGKVCKDCPRR